MTKAKKSTLNKIIDKVLTVVLILLFILIAVLAYGKITGKSIVKYSFLWVLTDSMEDTIPARSYVLVEKVDPCDIKERDVISFYSHADGISGELNTHRVIHILGENEAFITKGDNCELNDQDPVSASDVEFRYVRNLKIMTFFGRIFSTKFGILAFVTMILIMTSMWFFAYMSHIAKKEKELEKDRLVAQEVEKLIREAEKNKNSH